MLYENSAHTVNVKNADRVTPFFIKISVIGDNFCYIHFWGHSNESIDAIWKLCTRLMLRMPEWPLFLLCWINLWNNARDKYLWLGLKQNY